MSLTRPKLLIAGAAALGAGALFFYLVTHPNRSAAHGALTASGAPAPFSPIVGRLGPWGQLERFDMVVEPPAESVSAAECHLDPTIWLFRGWDRAAVETLLKSAALPAPLEVRLLSLVRCAAAGCQIGPTVADLAAIPPGGRAVIYGALAADDANYDQFNAFPMRRSEVDAWLAEAALPPPALAKVRSLLYPGGGDVVLFADMPVVCPMLSQAERARLVRTSCRTSGEIVRLRVEHGADVEKLVSYWGSGGRASQVRWLIESAARSPGGIAVSLTSLLPTFAKARVNTFPPPGSLSANCHWSSFNFFAETPDDRWLDPKADVPANLASRYREVSMAEMRFGDLLLYYDEKGALLHSAVYLADDIVFTKNGRGAARPFILMTMDDLSTRYFTARRITAVRRRDLDG